MERRRNRTGRVSHKILAPALAAALSLAVLLPAQARAERILYISAHGDDIILMSAHLAMAKNAGYEIHFLLTGNPADAATPLQEVMGEDIQLHGVEHTGPIQHKTSVMMDIVSKLESIDPHILFIQGWCGSHPGHEMTHIEVVKALQMATVNPAVYEYPTFTGFYGSLEGACPPIEELSRYWNSLIPLDEEFHIVEPTVEVDEPDWALAKKADLIVTWDIDWMIEKLACPNYDEEDLVYFNSQEKYRLLGDYNYLERPYDGAMAYETSDNWPYTFGDLRNYTLYLDETYGADLWTLPSATYGGRRIEIYHSDVHTFQVGLANKAAEADVFTLSAAWGAERTPDEGHIVFESDVVELTGETPTTVDAQLDTTGLLGERILWIKAVSQKAGEDPESRTDYVEIPVMINVTTPGCAVAAALAAGEGPQDERGCRTALSLAVILFSALLISTCLMLAPTKSMRCK